MDSDVLMNLRGLRGFVKRQSHNYRMILVRSAGAYFMMNLTSNYSIYTTGLGADSVALGGDQERQQRGEHAHLPPLRLDL